MDQQLVKTIRAFNRYYTGVLGLLNEYILQSRYSLAEVRVLFELYHQPRITARDLSASLGIDKGYLSRMLRKFRKKNLVREKTDRADRRCSRLILSTQGVREFEILHKASDQQIQQILEALDQTGQISLVNHMKAIRQILEYPGSLKKGNNEPRELPV